MGACEARRFVAEGARVVLGDVLDAEGEALAKELGDAAHYRHLDVTSEADWQAAVEHTTRDFGRLDILINNAALIFPAPFQQTAVKRLDLLHRINVRGPFLMTQAVLPHMIERGSGKVITISSGAADSPSANNLIYGMTKVSIEKMMEGLAAELGEQGIRSFGLKPEGMVLSPGATYHGLPNANTDTEPNDLMGRAAIWLITSDEAARHNGESFYSRRIVQEQLGG
jgi:3alpha(or 20beta)-hydroxysteroid dehydrogenase